jgi:hypothetical protein
MVPDEVECLLFAASGDTFQSPHNRCFPDVTEETAIAAEQGDQLSEQRAKGQASRAVREVGDLMPRIAGKQFIGALPIQHDSRAMLGS